MSLYELDIIVDSFNLKIQSLLFTAGTFTIDGFPTRLSIILACLFDRLNMSILHESQIPP